MHDDESSPHPHSLRLIFTRTLQCHVQQFCGQFEQQQYTVTLERHEVSSSRRCSRQIIQKHHRITLDVSRQFPPCCLCQPLFSYKGGGYCFHPFPTNPQSQHRNINQ